MIAEEYSFHLMPTVAECFYPTIVVMAATVAVVIIWKPTITYRCFPLRCLKREAGVPEIEKENEDLKLTIRIEKTKLLLRYLLHLYWVSDGFEKTFKVTRNGTKWLTYVKRNTSQLEIIVKSLALHGLKHCTKILGARNDLEVNLPCTLANLGDKS